MEGLKQAYDQRPNVKKLIKMLIALALVPVNQAAAGFLVIFCLYMESEGKLFNIVLFTAHQTTVGYITCRRNT